jgi:transposase
MEIVYPCCCGLDVHRKSVVACVLLTQPDGTVTKQIRTFGTMTADLLALSDWLAALEVTQIALESTGIYWQPVYALLEAEERTLVLVNAQHIKAVPGRKTDVKLRHEVAQVAVGVAEAESNLVFCHQYPTMACSRSNSTVRSPWDTVASLNGAALKP